MQNGKSLFRQGFIHYETLLWENSKKQLRAITFGWRTPLSGPKSGCLMQV